MKGMGPTTGSARPVCPVCRTPVQIETIDIPAYPGDTAAVSGRWGCPNGCDLSAVAAYTITTTSPRGSATVVNVGDVETACAAVDDMAIGETLTIQRHH